MQSESHDFKPIMQMLEQYFAELDGTIDKLAHLNEGATSKLEPWVMSHRHIIVGYEPNDNFYLVRISPSRDEGSAGDTAEALILDSQSALEYVAGEMSLQLAPGPKGMFISGFTIRQGNNPLDAEVHRSNDALLIATNGPSLTEMIGPGKGIKAGLDHWQRAMTVEGYPSIPGQVQQVFYRFAGLVKLKNFKERRIHRFINEHSRILLPPHKRKLYEHEIVSEAAEKRKADFILEREFGMPALLIELEAPVYQPFRKDGGDTKELTHARGQIAEWARWIDDEKANRKGDLKFLAGPKQRLVVMGRGLEDIEQMRNSHATDTIVWTYEMMLEEAKKRCIQELNDQRRLVGLEGLPPYK